jgi:hypothetical protein
MLGGGGSPAKLVSGRAKNRKGLEVSSRESQKPSIDAGFHGKTGMKINRAPVRKNRAPKANNRADTLDLQGDPRRTKTTRDTPIMPSAER